MFMVYYYFSVSREDNFISEIWQISVIVYFKQVQRDNQNIPFDLTNYWELVPPTSNNTWKRLYFISGDRFICLWLQEDRNLVFILRQLENWFDPFRSLTMDS